VKYRISALVLCVVLALSIVFTFGVAAQAETSAVITVENTAGAPGSTVEVDVTLTGNPGILGMTLNISWADGLTLINDQNGEALEELSYQAPKRYNSAGTNFVWYGTDVEEALDGTVLTLTFKISEDASDGEIYEINVTSKGVYDTDRQPVDVECIGGSVLVRNYVPGDVSGEGFVDPLDLIMLAQYISDNCMTDPEGYNVSINENAADVDDTGTLDPLDLILISQYISDGCITDPDSYNVVLKPSYPRCAHTGLAAVEAKGATCTENGNIAYWYCASCNKCFSDSSAKTVIRLSDTVIEAGAHTAMKQILAKAPTCTEDGNIAYWYCAACEKSFADAQGKVELSNAATVVGATGHGILSATPEKAPTCAEVGHIAYWYCGTCNTYFKDAEGTVETTLAETVISTAEHGENLSHVAAKEPTFEEKGNIEYWVCSLCGKYYSDANATTEITENDILIDRVLSYTINFVDDKNWPDGKKVQFAQNEDLILTTYLPPAVNGYTFEGWFTEDGTLRKSIPAGNTENLILHAKWDAIEYTIEYKDASKHGNPDEYTVEQEINLTAAEWSGLSFDKWTDEQGKEITKISKGSTGKITLYANWIYEENLAVPAKDTGIKNIVYDAEKNRYYFVYELGVIDNIVLETIGSNDKDAGAELTIGKSTTVTVEKNIANSVATAISNSISQTEEWSKNFSQTETSGINFEISGGLEKKDLFKIEASLGISYSAEDTREFGEHHSTTGGTEVTDSTSSSVSFTEGTSLTVETGYTISAEMPKGSYSYVCVGKVHVYGIVIFDPVENKYYLDTYSVMDEKLREKVLYEAPSNTTANIQRSGGLPFDVATTSGDLLAHLNSVYYIRYNANGGTATEPMLSSVHKIGQEQELLQNTYSRTGYTFEGWGLTPGGAASYTDQQEVKDLVSGNSVLTLYAIWKPIPYTVKWNTGTGYTITVTRTASPNVGAAIGKLSSGATVYYGDKLTIQYTANTGYTLTQQGERFVPVTTNVTANDIYASATANKYTVEYNANGGTGITASSTHTYGVSGALSTNGFSRHGWEFLGWSTDGTATAGTYTNGQSVLNMTAQSNGKVTLYAVWKPITSKTVTFANKSFDVGNVSEYWNFNVRLSDCFDVSGLRNYGYTKVRVTFKHTVDVDGDHLKTDSSGWYGFMRSDGLIDNVDKELYESDSEIKIGDDSSKSFTYSGETNISNVIGGDYYIGLTVWIHAWGFMDFMNEGTIKNVSIVIEFI